VRAQESGGILRSEVAATLPDEKASYSCRCRVSWKGSKKRKKKTSDKLDYYKLLGLETTRWMATDVQIKKGEQGTV
jgi:hypothetical protein